MRRLLASFASWSRSWASPWACCARSGVSPSYSFRRNALILAACVLPLAFLVSCGQQSGPASLQPGQPGGGTPGVQQGGTPSAGPAAPVQVSLPATIAPSDPVFAQGSFYIDRSANYCWSAGRIQGPSVSVPADKDVEVVVHLAGYLPPTIKPKLVVTQNQDTVFDKVLDGKSLNASKVIGPFKVPASAHNGKLSLTWAVDTWVPAKLGNPADKRNLGLAVRSIELRAAGG